MGMNAGLTAAMTARRRALALVAVVLAAMAVVTSCTVAPATEKASHGSRLALRLGYFPNLTHATAIVGIEKGIVAKALDGTATLEPRTFNAGPAAVESLFSGAVDATYIGPGPTTNAFVRSGGKAVRVIAGATAGGAALVVKPSIRDVSGLRGKRIATPQLGNTQDIALRYWLRQHGLRTDTSGGGDVNVVPQENSQTVQTFATGDIDGAWVPEPYVSRLVRDGGRVLVDERTLWPGGRFVTTNLLVRTAFLEEHPDAVAALLRGHVEATDVVNRDPAGAQRTIAESIGRLTGKPLPADLVAAAWKSLTFTNDPIGGSLLEGAKHAQAVGLLADANLDGLYDLAPLNRVLAAKGEATVVQP
jgi:NitT/TauT family transport system substrate-binding protein